MSQSRYSWSGTVAPPRTVLPALPRRRVLALTVSFGPMPAGVPRVSVRLVSSRRNDLLHESRLPAGESAGFTIGLNLARGERARLEIDATGLVPVAVEGE